MGPAINVTGKEQQILNFCANNYLGLSVSVLPLEQIRPSFSYFLFYRFFSQQVRVGGRNENKIHSDHFRIELKSKETQNSFGPFSN